MKLGRKNVRHVRTCGFWIHPTLGSNSLRRPSSICSSEIEAAVEAARAAFPGWSSRSPQERSQVLQRLADLLEQSLEELAQAESRDQGERHLCRPLPSFPRSLSLAESGFSAAVPSLWEVHALSSWRFTCSFQVVS